MLPVEATAAAAATTTEAGGAVVVVVVVVAPTVAERRAASAAARIQAARYGVLHGHGRLVLDAHALAAQNRSARRLRKVEHAV